MSASTSEAVAAVAGAAGVEATGAVPWCPLGAAATGASTGGCFAYSVRHASIQPSVAATSLDWTLEKN